MKEKTYHLWQRLWLRVNPDSSRPRQLGLSYEEPTSVPLSSLSKVPCLVLLGSPGLGKSSEVQLAAREALSKGEAAEIITLGRLSSADELTSRLTVGAKAFDSAVSFWNVFLDGLDEALPLFTERGNAIRDALNSIAQTVDLTRVRIRISCRSAEWPRELEADLKEFWSDLQIYDLEELSDQDVAIAASRFAPDQAARFLDQVRRHEVEALTRRPVTLNMLLDVFAKDAQLPTGRVGLYREALLTSLEDGNRSKLGPQSRLIVAARIAAACIFSNNTEVWTGLKEGLVSGRAIALSDISGGFEPTAEGSVPIGEGDLHQALLTSLFSLASDGLFVWSHQSFVEFLAAYYLVEHRLPPATMLEFLRISADARIAPQLREVSAWLASMDGAFFSSLITEEPDILLRSDIASASPQDREALVEELLKRYDNAELHDFDFGSRSKYDQLGHAGLGAQLRPIIEGRDKNIVARRVAIDIAEANGGAGLDDLLATIALDSTESYHIRTQAAAAIAKLANESMRLRLRSLIAPNPTDEKDELKGYALRTLWPQHLSVAELLAALTPEKDSSWIGSYTFFLSGLEIPELSDADAKLALDWIVSALEDENRSRTFERAIPRFLNAVWEQAKSPLVLRELAHFFLKLVANARYFSIQALASEFIGRISQTNDLRIALVKEIVRYTQDDNWSWLAASFPAPLVRDVDLGWLIDQLAAETEQFPESAAVELIVALSTRREINELDAVWDAAKKSELLDQKLTLAFSCDLNSAISRFQREDFERGKKRLEGQTRKRFDAVKAIQDRLRRVEEEDPFGWWELNLAFYADENGQLHEFNSSLRATSAWSSLDGRTQARLVDAAEKFLRETRPQSSAWLGTNTFHRPAAAAYRAFRLILETDSELFSRVSADTWKAWASCIFLSFNDDDEQVRQVIVRRAYECAPDTVRRCLARILLKQRSESAAREQTRLIDHCYDDGLGELFWKLLRRLNSSTASEAIAFYLAKKNHTKLSQLLRGILDGSAGQDAIFGNRKNIVAGISGLLDADPERTWEMFIGFRAQDESLAVEVIQSVAEGAYSEDSPILRMGEAQLAEFFIWTYRRIPPPPENQTGGARWVGPDEQVNYLRNAILKHLVSLGTTAAVGAVERISAELPEAPWLKYQLVDARRNADAKGWQWQAPADLIAAIAQHSPVRTVRSTKAAITAMVSEARVEGAVVGGALATEVKFRETVDLKSNLSMVQPRRILAVATEWRSGHGGISTFNRQLCIALAELGHEVACLVLNATETELADAKVSNIRLAAPPKDPGTSVKDLTSLLLFHKALLPSFEPELVLGHDHITGLAAHHIARRVYDARYVHFVHTLPEEIEKYKTRGEASLLRGGVKSGIQTQQCKQAQLVVAIGPRICADFRNRLDWAGVRVVEIQPGLNKNLTKFNASLDRTRRECLLVARLEDPRLKGAPLACRIITELNTRWSWQHSKRPKLILRGFTPEAFEAELNAIEGYKAAEEFVHCRPYTHDEDDIASDICAASVVIMPSMQEGFGLTALEAIAAGIPTVMTAESGIGEFLLSSGVVGVNALAEKYIADVIGDTNDVAEKWAKRIADIFLDQDAAFSDAASLRKALLPVLTWDRAARDLSTEMEKLLED